MHQAYGAVLLCHLSIIDIGFLRAKRQQQAYTFFVLVHRSVLEHSYSGKDVAMVFSRSISFLLIAFGLSSAYALPPSDYFAPTPRDVGAAPFDPNWNYYPDDPFREGCLLNKIFPTHWNVCIGEQVEFPWGPEGPTPPRPVGG